MHDDPAFVAQNIELLADGSLDQATARSPPVVIDAIVHVWTNNQHRRDEENRSDGTQRMTDGKCEKEEIRREEEAETDQEQPLPSSCLLERPGSWAASNVVPHRMRIGTRWVSL
jgi:hypothetical protein